MIEVLTEGEAGEWWEGRRGSDIGWFPSSYCSAPFDEGLVDASGVFPDGGAELQAVSLYPYQVAPRPAPPLGSEPAVRAERAARAHVRSPRRRTNSASRPAKGSSSPPPSRLGGSAGTAPAWKAASLPTTSRCVQPGQTRRSRPRLSHRQRVALAPLALGPRAPFPPNLARSSSGTMRRRAGTRGTRRGATPRRPSVP